MAISVWWSEQPGYRARGALRLKLIVQLAAEHQSISWQVFRDNSERLLKPFG
jgi:hypothetical protein